jgi:transposase
VLNGVFWVLGTGAQWRELPEKYPPYQTCHRRFQQWVRDGKLEEALRLLAGICTSEASSTWTKRSWMPPSRAPKRGLRVGPTRRGKGTKIVAVAAGDGLPLAVSVASASPAECSLWKLFWPDASSTNCPNG